MKIIGKRKQQDITFHASGEMLIKCARFNDEMHKMHGDKMNFFPKGIFRYKTHNDANRHWDEMLIKKIVEFNNK